MKKGFTLIELLGVIVVIAILSLIVVPIISKTIDDSQTNIDKRSLESYVRAIETSYYNEKANDNSLTPQQYIEKNLSKLGYKGSKIECASVEVLGEKIEDIELYDCKVDDRGYYSYIDYKSAKVEGKSIFKVKYNLSNVTSSNSITSIRNGKSYNTILTIPENQEIFKLEILMDGKNITDEVYNNGEITIEKVTGDIEITIKSSEVYTITYDLIDVMINNSEEKTYGGESYNATLITNEGYVISSITVIMNEEDITSSVYNEENKSINISNVIGNIKITAQSILKKANIEAPNITVYYDVSKGKTCTKEEYESSYSAIENDYTNSLTGYNGITKTNDKQNSCLKFYKYKEDTTIQTMILDHNTSSVQWSSFENTSGPNRLLPQLKTDTELWKGTIQPENYNVSQTNGTQYTVDYSGYNAWILSANEIANIAQITNFSVGGQWYYFSEGYGWLYDRTGESCTTKGCLNNSSHMGCYWTTTSRGESIAHAWSVTSDAWLYSYVNVKANELNCGVRPVITIPKS